MDVSGGVLSNPVNSVYGELSMAREQKERCWGEIHKRSSRATANLQVRVYGELPLAREQIHQRPPRVTVNREFDLRDKLSIAPERIHLTGRAFAQARGQWMSPVECRKERHG